MSDVLPRPLRFGVFLAPFHPADESPTEQLHRDLSLLQQLDAIGFDDVDLDRWKEGPQEADETAASQPDQQGPFDARRQMGEDAGGAQVAGSRILGSVGIEDADDLIADLAQAIEASKA